jgi:tRNA(Met) C34 N-acetyltransferase TmcA
MLHRRFGKTFSIAIFTAAMALATSCEVVIFSPARRASRKLLERVVEFLKVLDCEDRIVEFNQEACRIQSYDGKKSLIRSFPSKVGVREPHAHIFELRVLGRAAGGSTVCVCAYDPNRRLG